MSGKINRLAILVILGKIGPKLVSMAAKLVKALPALIKGATGIKVAGGAASIGLYTLLFSWQMALSLVVFILIHEYGHLRAMQLCGIKTRGIYLIPGFGGAAVAAEKFRSAKNEVYIALMGPLAGLIFIVPMIGLYFATDEPMFAAIASVMSLINLFNLFPINPLDGGRAAKGLLYSLKGSFGFFFSFLSIFVAIIVSWYTGLSLLVFIGIIGLSELIHEYGLANALKSFVKTMLRGIGIYFGSLLLSNTIFMKLSWTQIMPGIILVLICLGFIWDIYKSTNLKGWFFLEYPVVIVKDFFRSFKELVSIRPSDLRRVDEYTPMDGRAIVLYSLAYILTFVAMVTLVVLTAKIPGCEMAMEMLM